MKSRYIREDFPRYESQLSSRRARASSARVTRIDDARSKNHRLLKALVSRVNLRHSILMLRFDLSIHDVEICLGSGSPRGVDIFKGLSVNM